MTKTTGRRALAGTALLLLPAILCLSLSLQGCFHDQDGTGTGPAPETPGQETRPEKPAAPMKRPKALILMIADGGGFSQARAEALFRTGSWPAYPWNRADIALAVSTWPAGGSYDPDAALTNFSYLPVNPTDSAAAATALATGRKTTNGRISVGADGTVLETLLERAEKKGMLTGIVTSVPISHATPAAFAAHGASRNDCAALADRMIYGSGLDVLMGCGNPEADDDGNVRGTGPDYTWISRTAWEALRAGSAANDRDGDGILDPWVLVTDRDSIVALPGAGQFVHAACIPAVHETLRQRRSGDAGETAFSVPFPAGVPTLAEMTEGALALLSRGDEGFVLVVEGGAIDWACHAHQGGRMIEEMEDFTDSVIAVLDWIDASPYGDEALLAVTADHETGYLLGPGSGPGTVREIVNRGADRMPDMEWFSAGHTNALVPFWAYGLNAGHFAADIAGRDPLRGWYLDNASLGARLLLMLE